MHAEFSRGLTALSYALDYDQNIYVYITLFTQVYIVSGGIGVILEGGWRSKAINLASTGVNCKFIVPPVTRSSILKFSEIWCKKPSGISILNHTKMFQYMAGLKDL